MLVRGLEGGPGGLWRAVLVQCLQPFAEGVAVVIQRLPRVPAGKGRPLVCDRYSRGSDSTGHVAAATHRRLDLSMLVGALGNVDGRSFGRSQCVVHEFLTALSASHGSYTHSALFTRVCCHQVILLCFSWFPAAQRPGGIRINKYTGDEANLPGRSPTLPRAGGMWMSVNRLDTPNIVRPSTGV